MNNGKHSKKDKENQTLVWTIANTIINLLRLIADIFRTKH